MDWKSRRWGELDGKNWGELLTIWGVDIRTHPPVQPSLNLDGQSVRTFITNRNLKHNAWIWTVLNHSSKAICFADFGVMNTFYY